MRYFTSCTDFLSHKAEALQDALKEFCPRLSAPKELKRFYDTISPSMDASGSTLYRMAKELTGIDVPSLFPYEDNRGLFEVSVIESQPTELKLYSPLSGELRESEYDRPQVLDGNGLAMFQKVILQGIEDERMPEEEGRGLMAYFDGTDVVNEKVFSLFPTVENMNGVLCGVAVCRIHGKLSPDELAELKEYCAAQYNDSWGEGFAQRPRHTEYGELYVSFYTDSGASILTKSDIPDGEVCIWSVLLHSKEEYSQQDLSDILSLPRQTVNSLISNFVKKGFATLEHIPGTRNQKVIRLTDAGIQYGESNVKWIFEAEQRAMEESDPQEIEAMISLLEKYILRFRAEIDKKQPGGTHG